MLSAKDRTKVIKILKHWKYLDVNYKCFLRDALYDDIRFSIDDINYTIPKDNLIIFIEAFDMALELLSDIEFKVIKLCYYNKYTNQKAMDELYLIRSTFFYHKQNAINKLSDILPTLINKYQNL